MSRLSDALSDGSFVITSEIGPEKGTNLEKCLNDAELIRDKVVAVNVTDNQSAVMRVGSLAVCHLLKERGIEPVFQMVCRDRNRIALQSDLLSASVLGIENVLCLTGDHNVLGDHNESKPVFDLDSVQLLEAVSSLNNGYDLAGHELNGTPKLFPGAVVTPGLDPIEPQMIKMEKKIKAGARFFQTQAIYETRQFEDFMKKVGNFKVPVLTLVWFAIF